MPVKTVLFNDFRRQWEDTGEAMKASFEAVGESGWYILGQEVRTFEEELARFWSLSHAIGVASGLDALEISLRVLGCRAGDKVLTTPISAFATTLAILKIGAVPVFTECDASGLIDLDACERVLGACSDIRFFVPVHLYGHSLDWDKLRNLRQRHGITVVEDCAQSIGARWQGHLAGTAGDLAATSFYPTKNLGALGDGGAILTNNADFARAAAQYRDYGQSAKYKHERIGYNSRLDELQAGLLRRVGLVKLGEWTGRRRDIACRYLLNIANPHIRALGAASPSESVWHLFPVLVDPARKAAFLNYMHSNGVVVAEHYPIAIFDQPAMTGVQYEVKGDLSKARHFCQSEVSLPNHPYLTEDEVTHVIDLCNRWGG
jgi:dTDP-4-amino-4,6-dideoxygalactose transaminase